jgi:hypothetical protein
MDQVRSLRTIEAAARLSDLGEETAGTETADTETADKRPEPEKTSASNREAIQLLVVPYME